MARVDGVTLHTLHIFARIAGELGLRGRPFARFPLGATEMLGNAAGLARKRNDRFRAEVERKRPFL